MVLEIDKAFVTRPNLRSSCNTNQWIRKRNGLPLRRTAPLSTGPISIYKPLGNGVLPSPFILHRSLALLCLQRYYQSFSLQPEHRISNILLEVCKVTDANMPHKWAIVSSALGHEHLYLDVAFSFHDTPKGRAQGSSPMLAIEHSDPTATLSSDNKLGDE
ncbi:hypothetical protein G7Y89_g10899 [Cudoniella acicularis]|uniref:Uncharacterized protein n=1 Tax=Cudoniella acicularis TaxID=354080 RepID=A0A8H4REP5_9HELO|nr:hypothetical protein G7Y89_g10899 [Cudoniella acicularis]